MLDRTDSYCERCGTRYAFGANAPRTPVAEGRASPGKGAQELRADRRAVDERRDGPGAPRRRARRHDADDRGVPPHLQLLHDVPSVRLRQMLERPPGRVPDLRSRAGVRAGCARGSPDRSNSGGAQRQRLGAVPRDPRRQRRALRGRSARPVGVARSDLEAVASGPGDGGNARKAHDQPVRRPEDQDAWSVWPIADEIAPEMTLTPGEMELVEAQLAHDGPIEAAAVAEEVQLAPEVPIEAAAVAEEVQLAPEVREPTPTGRWTKRPTDRRRAADRGGRRGRSGAARAGPIEPAAVIERPSGRGSSGSAEIDARPTWRRRISADAGQPATPAAVDGLALATGPEATAPERSAVPVADSEARRSRRRPARATPMAAPARQAARRHTARSPLRDRVTGRPRGEPAATVAPRDRVVGAPDLDHDWSPTRAVSAGAAAEVGCRPQSSPSRSPCRAAADADCGRRRPSRGDAPSRAADPEPPRCREQPVPASRSSSWSRRAAPSCRRRNPPTRPASPTQPESMPTRSAATSRRPPRALPRTGQAPRPRSRPPQPLFDPTRPSTLPSRSPARSL